jgi:hypothetical protein
MSVTLALTGIGVAYFDDVRIEPLVPGARQAGFGPLARPLPPRGSLGPTRPGVVPAGGIRP